MRKTRPSVLMVTGAYFPELSGAGLQCRALIGQLRDRVDFTVLTTTADRSLPVNDVQDGVAVHRVFLDPTSLWSKARGLVLFTRAFLRMRRAFAIVHLHGFSQKSILLVGLALAGRKRIAIKMTSVGVDDPISLRQQGGLANWAYGKAERFFAISPRFVDLYRAAEMPPARLRFIPNGVNLDRFRPAAPGERDTLRRDLSIPAGNPVVLFVGFFSREKRPDLLFEAWAAVVRSSAPHGVLVFVGATRSPYSEVDEDLADEIRRRGVELGLSDRLHFVESTDQIERFHRAADIFVLPSVREGLPNVLLEAMASGVSCIATRIAGVTDRVIDDGRNGLLVPPDDVVAIEGALCRVLDEPGLRARLEIGARRTVEAGYGLTHTAQQYYDEYCHLVNGEPCVA